MAHRFPGEEKARLRDEHRRKAQPAEDIISRMSLREDEVVVDLGCGTGYLTVPMAARAAKVIGVDAQAEMLQALRDMLPEGSDNVELIQAELPPVPLEDRSVDRAVIVNVFHEVGDKPLMAREVLRVLRPGGRLSLVEFPRRETSFGPPLEERMEADEVIAFFKGLRIEGRWDLMEYYQLELVKPD